MLYISGSLRPDLVGQRKTKKHTPEVFQRLIAELNFSHIHISLPNILTEASNHLGSGRQQAVPNAAEALAAYIARLEEIYQPSRNLIGISEYLEVGLADAAVISCVPRLISEKVRVFTEDYELYNRLSGYDVDCLNIMHWATPRR